MSFGLNLKKLRQERGLTQQQVADELGITKATYSGYETGRREPDVFKIKALAKLFDVSGDDLLETGYVDTNKKSPEPEEPVSEAEIEQLAIQLYNALLSAGLVEEGQELTKHQMRAIEGICDILAVVFDSEN